MGLALLDEERKLVECMLAFANMRRIKSAVAVAGMFWRGKYPSVKQPWHVKRLARLQQRVRWLLTEITHSKAGRERVVGELGLLGVRANVYLGTPETGKSAGKRRLVYEFDLAGGDPVRTVKRGCLAAIALILDETRGLTNRLQQCGWSRCRRFGVDFAPKGRPRRFCNALHKKHYDGETSGERVKRSRDHRCEIAAAGGRARRR